MNKFCKTHYPLQATLFGRRMKNYFFATVVICTTCACNGQSAITNAQETFAKAVVESWQKAEVTPKKDDAIQHYDPSGFFKLYASVAQLKDAGLTPEIYIDPKQDFYREGAVPSVEYNYQYQIQLYFLKHYNADGAGVQWKKVKYDSCAFTKEADSGKAALYTAYIFFYDDNAYHTRYAIRFNHVAYIEGKFYAGIPLDVYYARSIEEYELKQTGNYPEVNTPTGPVVKPEN